MIYILYLVLAAGVVFSSNLAAKYNLYLTGGSDFHGTAKPGLELGTGYGDLAVPESFLKNIL